MSDMTIQATVKRTDGVQITVSGGDTIDVVQTMILLVAKAGIEEQLPSSKEYVMPGKTYVSPANHTNQTGSE